jgi:single-strand DNA-binding protein
VEGQLQTRKWQDQNGNDRYNTEIVLQGFGGTLTMLDNPSSGGSDRKQSPRREPEHNSYGDQYDDKDLPF